MTIMVFRGKTPVSVLTIGTYIEFYYIEVFSANKCQNFEGVSLTLWSLILKVLPSVNRKQVWFSSYKDPIFEQQRP